MEPFEKIIITLGLTFSVIFSCFLGVLTYKTCRKESKEYNLAISKEYKDIWLDIEKLLFLTRKYIFIYNAYYVNNLDLRKPIKFKHTYQLRKLCEFLEEDKMKKLDFNKSLHENIEIIGYYNASNVRTQNTIVYLYIFIKKITQISRVSNSNATKEFISFRKNLHFFCSCIEDDATIYDYLEVISSKKSKSDKNRFIIDFNNLNIIWYITNYNIEYNNYTIRDYNFDKNTGGYSIYFNRAENELVTKDKNGTQIVNDTSGKILKIECYDMHISSLFSRINIKSSVYWSYNRGAILSWIPDKKERVTMSNEYLEFLKEFCKSVEDYNNDNISNYEFQEWFKYLMENYEYEANKYCEDYKKICETGHISIDIQEMEEEIHNAEEWGNESVCIEIHNAEEYDILDIDEELTEEEQ